MRVLVYACIKSPIADTINTTCILVDDPRQRKPDIRVAKEKIEWQPIMTVKEGLRRTVEYFKSELDTMGEIIPTGPKAERPQPLIKLIIDVNRPRDERRLQSEIADTESRYSNSDVRDGISEILVDADV